VLTWLRHSLSAADLSKTETPQQLLATLDTARAVAVKAGDRLGDFRSQLNAVESALAGVARHLRGRDPETALYLPELQAWLGKRFSAWFNNPRVRQELLPMADRDVHVDVLGRQVVWQERGSTRSRPLEAFSSGHQAFAYTRARLAALDEDSTKPQNRLIALDEFGAFIAHDLLSGLLEYLRERAKERPDDQVVVILPLSRNYTELANTALPNEAQVLRQMAAQIADRSYAVRQLE
jgi:hypothetical protein